MHIFTRLTLCFVFSTLLTEAQAQNIFEPEHPKSDIKFKENKGQVYDQFYKARPDILYYGLTGQFSFHLKKNGISYQLEKIEEWKTETPVYLASAYKKERREASSISFYRLDIDWLNVNPDAEIVQGERLPGVENYYNETSPEGALQVKNYSALLYKNLYPGIDLKWFGTSEGLKYEYYVATGSDYKQIQLQYAGAEKIYLSPKGELIIKTPLGELVEQKPYVTQNAKKLEANWLVKDNVISFDIKNYNSNLPLVIDPLIRLWGTYYGGAGNDYINSLASDNLGNTYLGGEVKSTSNLATSGAHQSTFGGTIGYWGDAFVSKFNPNGVLQWATYYGGAQSDFANSITVDANGNVYMTGGTSTTNSAVMATPGAHQSVAPSFTVPGPVNDAFLVKFNSSGVRQWGTYYGGTNYEWAYGVAVNTTGDIAIVGTTKSTNSGTIATPGSHQSSFAGGLTDGFIAKFDASGTRLWGTYFGGSSGQDDVLYCNFDAGGNIYINGGTPSTNSIATSGAHQTTYGGGSQDGFLAKFTASGQLLWGTYYGGAGTDNLFLSAIDANGDIYLAGTTSTSLSGVVATASSHQPAYGGNTDGLLVKFNSAGVRQWATYYGGLGNDYAAGPSIDPMGDIYISGGTSTSSGTAIASSCAYQENFKGGSSDAYLAKFNANGSRIWGTYFGSIYTDDGGMCAADIHNNIYITGATLANSGTVMATSGAHQTTFGGQTDTYLQKFNGCTPGNALNMTPVSNLLVCPGTTATLSATCGNWYSTLSGTTSLFTGSDFTTGIISSDSTFYVEDFSCGSISGPRTAISLTLSSSPTVSLINSNPVACVQESVVISASGASTYSWINTSATTSSISFYVLLQTTYTVIGTGANGCQNTATLTVVPNLCLGTNELADQNAQLTVYPNPAKGQVTIRSASEVNLILVNELGQAIRYISLNTTQAFEATLTDLPNGIYFLKNERDGTMLNKKIVVMH
ncbi:hypothetical protein CNR22_08955 [Sphingobacteriaceae bacterium]|nr:hypothetical protein CNR22_08955 [Sphingobacteriaceae bacterium]